MLDHKCRFTAIIAPLWQRIFTNAHNLLWLAFNTQIKKENETTNSMNFDR